MEIDYEIASTIPIPKKKFFCVEYPGYVKNLDRALNTLGGEKALATAITNQKAVELRFRHQDPFSHPINGDIVPTANLLVKITRRVKKGRPEEEATYKTDIVGTISKTCRFRGLADFQYLVPRADKMGQLKQAMASGDVDSITKFAVADDYKDTENLKIVPPPIFSTVETPMHYKYVSTLDRLITHDYYEAMRRMHLLYEFECDSRMDPSLAELTRVPTQPKIPLRDLEGDARMVQEKIAKLFEERPIWSRNAVRNCLPEEDHKHIRRYQLIDIRRPDRGKTGAQESARAKRNRYLPRFAEHSLTTGDVPNQARQKKEDEGSNRTPGPDAKSAAEQICMYQLCDLPDIGLDSLVENPAYLKPTCSKYDGFFYKCVYTRLRLCLRKKLLENSGKNIDVPFDFDIEEGLAEAVEKEKLEKTTDEGFDELDIGQDWEAAATQTEVAVEGSKNKKTLTAMVDEYMSRLQDEKFDDEYDIDMDELEEYDVFGEDEEIEEEI
ncbi:tau 95 subunit of transcription factor TFIIIC [Apophysomyces sp. BC1015]|nr:tau 95 subunit of transcription factor TFIIIC [Apophysomyces sp. BC1015]